MPTWYSHNPNMQGPKGQPMVATLTSNIDTQQPNTYTTSKLRGSNNPNMQGPMEYTNLEMQQYFIATTHKCTNTKCINQEIQQYQVHQLNNATRSSA